MKIVSSSTDIGQVHQRAVRIGRRTSWGIYLSGAVSLFALWFVAGLVVVSYLFLGWIMAGALLLWFIEDTAEF
jgi:hypothetical protein